jgi:hypothetical protein
MAHPNFELGPVHILPEMICEPVTDMIVWIGPSKKLAADIHRVVVSRQSALTLIPLLLDAAGVPPSSIELTDEVKLRPYYASRSPSDPLGHCAMIAFALDCGGTSNPNVVAMALVAWASRHALEKMIVDGVEVYLSKGADTAVAVCERALMDN